MGDAAERLERRRKATEGFRRTAGGSSSGVVGGVDLSKVKPFSIGGDSGGGDSGGGDSGGGGGKSLLGQVGSVFSALPSGLAGLGAQAWNSTAGNVGSTIQSVALRQNSQDIRNRKGPLGSLGRVFANEEMQEAIERGDSFRNQLEAALPLFNEIGASGTDTVGRVTDQVAALAPGGKAAGEGAYAQAVRDSTIVPVLLEDVGNAALAGAVAGQAVGGAGRAMTAARGGAPLVGKTAGPAGYSAYRAAVTTRARPGTMPIEGRFARGAETMGRAGAAVDDALGKAILSPIRIPGAASRLITGEGMSPAARLRTGRGLGQVIGDTQRWQDFRESGTGRWLGDKKGFGSRGAETREAIAEAQFRSAIDTEEVAVGLQNVLRITDDDAVQGAAAIMDVAGVADALGSMGKLPDEVLDPLVQQITESSRFGDMVEMFDPETVAEGLKLAVRVAHDPDAVSPAIRKVVEDAGAEWRSRVEPVTQRRFEEQVGRSRTVDDSTIQTLMGDDILPYEMIRVLGDYATERADLEKGLEKQIDKRDRKAGKVRFDDDLFEGGAKVSAQRAREIEGAVAKVIDSEGLFGVAEMLDDIGHRDLDDASLIDLDETKIQSRVEKALRSELSGRALARTQGLTLPTDALSDVVDGLDLKPILSPMPVQLSQKVRREAGKRGAAEQAAADVSRLEGKAATAQAKADRLADVAADALLPSTTPTLGRLSRAMRAKFRADAKVRSSAGALTRIKNTLRDRSVGEKQLETEVRQARRLAKEYLKAEAEAIDRVVDTYIDTFDHADPSMADYVAMIDQAFGNAGFDARSWKNMTIGPNRRRVASSAEGRNKSAKRKASKAYNDALEQGMSEAQARKIASDVQAQAGGKPPALDVMLARMEAVYPQVAGDMNAAVERFAQDLVRLKELRAQSRNLKVDDDFGQRFWQYAEDPETQAVLTGTVDDALEGLREIRSERFAVDEWGEVEGVGRDMADIDMRAADDAAGDPRILTPDDQPAAPSDVGRDFAADAFDDPTMARGAQAAYDNARARAQRDQAGRVVDNEARRVTNEAARRGARGAAGPSRRAGEAAGTAKALQDEARLAERRSGRTDDLAQTEAEAFAGAVGGAARTIGREAVARADLRAANKAVNKAIKEIDKLDAGLADALEAARNKVESAPAKYRPAIQIARAADEAIGEMLEGADAATSRTLTQLKGELVTDVVAALDAIEDPMFIQTGKVMREGGDGSSRVAAPAAKSSSEYVKSGVIGPATVTDQTVSLARGFGAAARVEVAKWIVGRYGKTARVLLEAEGFDVDAMSRADILRAVQNLDGPPMQAWNIRSLNGLVPENQVNPDTTFVPRFAVDTFEDAFKATGDAERFLQKFYDNPTRWWKHSVLALSTGWHQGNIVGNMLMSWAGGVSPLRMIELMPEAYRTIKRLYEGNTIDGDPSRRLLGAGPTFEAIDAVNYSRSLDRGVGDRQARKLFGGPNRLQRRLMTDELEPDTRRGRFRNAALRPIQSSYRLNGWVDDFNHVLVYLDRTTKGMSPEVALRDSLKIAGDFSKMTRTERQFIRRVLPFYSWMRHITTLSADLAVNHPLRSAWTLHLWTLAGGDEDYSDIGSLFGAIPLGDDRFIRGNRFMPFNTVLDFDPSDPLGTVASSMGPLIKYPMEVGTGVKAGPGGLEVMSGGEMGERDLGPIGVGPAFHRLLQLTPQTRTAQQLFPGRERVARTDRGDPWMLPSRFGRVPIPDENLQSTPSAIGRNLLGLPLPVRSDPERIRAQRDR